MIFLFGQAFQHKGVGGNHLDRSHRYFQPLKRFLEAHAIIGIGDMSSYKRNICRIDIFVLLDLIGAGDMSFMKLESSTGED